MSSSLAGGAAGQAESWEPKASCEQRVVSSPLKAVLFRSGNQSFSMTKCHSFCSFVHRQQLQKYVLVHTQSELDCAKSLLSGRANTACCLHTAAVKIQQENRQERLRRPTMPFAGPAGNPKVRGILKDAGCWACSSTLPLSQKAAAGPRAGPCSWTWSFLQDWQFSKRKPLLLDLSRSE